MKLKIFLQWMSLCGLLLLLSACGDSSSGSNPNANPKPNHPNQPSQPGPQTTTTWDNMNWDQGQWQ